MPERTAVKIAAAVLTGGVAMSALAGCYVDVGALQHRTSRYLVSGMVQTLVVNDHVGSVHVIGGDSGRVSVTEHLTFRHTAPAPTPPGIRHGRHGSAGGRGRPAAMPQMPRPRRRHRPGPGGIAAAGAGCAGTARGTR